MKKKTLSASELRRGMKAAQVPYASSADIPLRHKLLAHQPRALQALELALNIQDPGYNVFLAGEPNMGRSYMLRDFLQPRAKKAVVPPDLVYVHNFENPDVPLLLSLPPGQGRKLKSAMQKAVNRLRKELPLYLERESYTKRRNLLQERHRDDKNRLVAQMDKLAEAQGFKLDVDEQGAMTLYPLMDGKRLDEQGFENLKADQRTKIKLRGDSLAQSMQVFLRKIGRMEQDYLDGERNLEREIASEFLDGVLDPLAEKFKAACNGSLPEQYFKALREDVLENLDFFLTQDYPPQPGQGGGGQGGYHDHGPVPPSFMEVEHHYSVNVFVDNSKTVGAPIVFEDHPTVSNLLGCIERESEMGALVTNFTLAKAGALHRANGGFLVLQIEDVLQCLPAWEGLLRALRSGQARLDDSGDGEGVKTKGIRPSPVNLNLKVILIGPEDIYDALYMGDSRFCKLFKIKAQMSGRMPRNSAGTKVYLQEIRRIVEEASLLHFDRESMANLVDFGSLLLEDQKFLSQEFPKVRELMIEASAHARMAGSDMVRAEHLRQAKEAREFRLNLVEEAFMEEYDRNLIKVRTSGQGIGTVNGLSVTAYGDFEIGLPHQISCTVAVGHGGIIDLEREAELGGPIHTKAIMILKSYLYSLFARKRPINLAGSICFEQSYAGVEGDSASGAELAALLSAIAQAPINMGLAFTGALSQSGQIMAVGAVSRKVEGFFEVCRRHGLSGSQGVIIPKDNLEHLILKDAVLEAMEEELFHIYPVEHISEAMELLTGLPCGRLRKDGSFTPGTLYHTVDKRLAELTRLSLKAERGRE